MKRKVLFVCTHNSARSQMAEGLLDNLFSDFYESQSAGTEPRGVDPHAIKVMKEIGIDISNNHSKSINNLLGTDFDLVVTVCEHAKDSCPVFPGGKQYLHKSFEDPSLFKGGEKEILNEFRKVRDQIKKWIQETFVREEYSAMTK